MCLLCYFLKLIGTGARKGGGVDSGIRFRGDSESIRRCRPFPVHVTAAKGRRMEGTGRKGGGNNTKVLGAVFNGAAVSTNKSVDDEEDSRSGIKGSPHSPPAAMEFCEGFADRVIESRR